MNTEISQNFVRISQELIFTKNEKIGDLNEMPIPYNPPIPICAYPFKGTHTFLILIYLLSKVNKDVYGKTVIVSVKEILDGVGLNSKSKDTAQRVRKSLIELQAANIINVYKEVSVPKYVSDHFEVPKEQQKAHLEYKEKNLKRGEFFVDINKSLVYEFNKNCASKPFIKLPLEILSTKDLSATDKLVYIILYKLTNIRVTEKCKDFDEIVSKLRYVTTNEIAEVLGVSDRTVRRSTSKLEELGYLAKNVTWRKDDKSYKKIGWYFPKIIFWEGEIIVADLVTSEGFKKSLEELKKSR